MTTTTTGARPRPITGDAEVTSVLVCLAPLFDAGRLEPVRQRLLSRREFDVESVLDSGWSSGERVLIQLAGVLWNGSGACDLGYLITMMGGEFFQAAMDAIAVRQHANISTDGAAALDRALAT